MPLEQKEMKGDQPGLEILEVVTVLIKLETLLKSFQAKLVVSFIYFVGMLTEVWTI